MNNEELNGGVEVQAQSQSYYEKLDTDEGYIEDELQIELEKIRRTKDVLYNDMLGEYNEKGEYKLSQSIMQELIDMPKKIDVIDDNGIEARGFLGDRIFEFTISKPKLEDNGNAYCFLVLHEKIERMGGYYIDTNAVVVATYEYKYDKFYLNHIKEVFNLKEYEDDTTGEEGRTFYADKISLRFKELAVMREVGDDVYERLEEIYFNRRIQLLGLSAQTALIMAEFTSRKNKLEPFFMNTTRKYYFLNQLLDDCLQKKECAECLENSDIKEQMQALDKKFVEKNVEVEQKIKENPQVQKIRKQEQFKDIADLENLGRETTQKPTQKPMPKGVTKGDAGKPKSKKKGGGGKSKGGGGKKDSKKKDDKKPFMAVYTPPKPAPKEEQSIIGSLVPPKQDNQPEPSPQEPDETKNESYDYLGMVR